MESIDAESILEGRERIFDAVLGLDGDTIRRELTDRQAKHGNDLVVADILVPVLRTVGDMWESGRLGVMHEHYASAIIRSTIGAFRKPLVTNTDSPKVVLCCPPGELHDLPGHLFSLMLLERRLTPIVLGADAPWKAIAAAVRTARADACIISGMRPNALRWRTSIVAQIATVTNLFVAGPIGGGDLPPGAQPLPDDWRVAADLVASTVVPLDTTTTLTPG